MLQKLLSKIAKFFMCGRGCSGSCNQGRKDCNCEDK